eukprot:gene11119-19997_t
MPRFSTKKRKGFFGKKNWEIVRQETASDTSIGESDDGPRPSTSRAEHCETPSKQKHPTAIRNLSAEKLSNTDFEKVEKRIITRDFSKRIGLSKPKAHIEEASGVKIQDFSLFQQCLETRLQIEPFMFEPGADGLEREDSFLTKQGSTSDSDEEEEMPDVNLERIGNTEWCQYGTCKRMPTGRESLCCREVYRVWLKADDKNLQCIGEDEDFKTVCLNTAVILTAIYQYVEDETYLDDEPTFEYKSRIGFLQYMPKKPKKFGIKLWALCETASGYCLQFQIYTGRSSDGAEHGLAVFVVFDLILPYLDKGYHLFFDNFYTILKLVKDLLARNIFSCGTIRVDRGAFPVSFKNTKLERGETVYIRNGDIVAVFIGKIREIFSLLPLSMEHQQDY